MPIPIGNGPNPVFQPPRPPQLPSIPDPPAVGNPLHPAAPAPNYGAAFGPNPEAQFAQLASAAPGGQPDLPSWMAFAAQIDAFLRKRKSPLYGQGDVFARVAQRRKLDPFLMPSIAAAESSLGENVKPGEFNPFGWGPHIQFPSWAKAIRTVGKGLQKGYTSKGLDTFSEIGPKYVYGDTSGMRKPTNWIKNASATYNELEKMSPAQKTKLMDIMGGFDWTDLGGPGPHGAKASNHIWQNMNAVDLGAPVGTPIYAPFGGQLVGGFGNSGSSGQVFGQKLSIFNPRLNNTAFLTHMSRYGPGITEGGRVKKGDILGYVGPMPGGPSHLHFATQFGDPYQYLNGGRVLPTMGGVAGPGGYGGGATGNPYNSNDADRNAQEWQAAEQERAMTVFGAAMEGAESPGNSRRAKKRKKYVDNLINSLMQGGGNA